MRPAPMPEPLVNAVNLLVSEAVLNCQEVLRHTEPDAANRWARVTLYRATDAADTMDMAALLIAAYCEREGMPKETLDRYLQVHQQHSRASGPRESERQEVAGMLGGPVPGPDDPEAQRDFSWGQIHARGDLALDDDPQKLFAKACLHGLRARLCDDLDTIDSCLPPHVAHLARKVAEALEMPQPATT